MRIVLVAIGWILMVIGTLVAAASGLYVGISLVATILAPSLYSVVALLYSVVALLLFGTICLAGIGTWGFGRALRRVNACSSLSVDPVSKGLAQS